MRKLSLILVMAFLMAGALCAQSIDSTLSFQIKMSTPDLNLFFMDHGFLDIVQTHGAVGMMINPAGLERTKGIDVFVSGSLSKSVSSEFGIKVIDSSAVSPSISVPTSLTLTDQGGLDYVGVAGKVGPFGLGVAVQRGSGLEMVLDSGITSVSRQLTYNYPYLLDSTMVPGLPFPVTVNMRASGTGVIEIAGQGDAKLMNTPVFLGAGTKFGPFKMGLGLKMTKVTATGDFMINASARMQNLRGIVGDTISGIIIDSIEVHSSFDSSIFYDNFECKLSGTQISTVLSANFEIPILKAGMSIETGLPYTLKGEYFNSAGIPFGEPRLDSVNVDSLFYNPADSSVTGTAKLYLGGVDYKHKTGQEEGGIDFPGTMSVKASLGLKFWGFRLGVNGGMDLMNGQWPMLGKAYTSAGTSLSIKKATMSIGVAANWQYVALEQDKIYTTPPMVLAGVGMRMPVYVGEVMLATRINLANGVLKVQNMSKVTDFKPWETLALSAGVRFDLGFLSKNSKKSQKTGAAGTIQLLDDGKPKIKVSQTTTEFIDGAVQIDTMAVKTAVAIYASTGSSYQDAYVYSEFLRTEMNNTGRFVVMPRDRMNELLTRSNLMLLSCAEPNCASQMGKALNVRQMLVGLLSKTEEGYQVAVLLVNPATGQVMLKGQDKGFELSDICSSAKEMAQRLVVR